MLLLPLLTTAEGSIPSDEDARKRKRPFSCGGLIARTASPIDGLYWITRVVMPRDGVRQTGGRFVGLLLIVCLD